MVYTKIAVGLTAAAFAASGMIPGAQSSPQSGSTSATSTKQGASAKKNEVTLSGCVRQTSDDPRVFALITSAESRKSGSTGSATTASKTADANTAATKDASSKPAGTTGWMDRSPAYRLQDSGQKLKGHLGQKVEITGTVTPAKDEKGADIIMSRAENIGVDTVTITTIDLAPAPILDVSSVHEIAGECPAAGTALKHPEAAERRP